METISVVKKIVCKCGAVTLWFSNGAVNSMTKSTYKRLRKIYHTMDGQEEHFWACDKCCNGYCIENGTQKLGEVQKSIIGWGNTFIEVENRVNF
jgi:hypothetical protein